MPNDIVRDTEEEDGLDRTVRSTDRILKDGRKTSRSP